MGLSCQRIGKEHNEIDDPFYNLGSNLLITSQRAAVVAFYRQAR